MEEIPGEKGPQPPPKPSKTALDITFAESPAKNPVHPLPDKPNQKKAAEGVIIKATKSLRELILPHAGSKKRSTPLCGGFQAPLAPPKAALAKDSST